MQYRQIKIKDNTKKVESSSKDSLLDELLALRGITLESQIKDYLNPDKENFISPYVFCDMQKSKVRIDKAIKNKEKILIWGDFDCDGVTSTTILYKALSALNASIATFIPNRLAHGHGLNTKELLKFVAKEKVKLVISVDCASSNISEINLLKSLGVDTIVTDHHTIDTEAPNSYAIINPQVKNAIKEDVSIETITSLTYNCGAIIAYKLAMALLEQNNNIDLKEELLVIASIGAIADVVPLIGENRSIVALGLKLLNEKKENSNKGAYKLLYKNLKDKQYTSYDIGFILAPRINAVGRLGDAKLSFDFLNTTDDTKLDFIIEKLDNYNKIRQAKCQETYDEIFSIINSDTKEQNSAAIVLINPDWHIGIIGIAAAKVVEQFNKPCFLMTVDESNNARCSIRSNDSINVYEVLKENENLFLGFGGHKLAGGCSFSLDKVSFDEVKSALIKTITEKKEDIKEDNILYCDCELKIEDIELNLLDTINKLEPFGQSNEPPLFALFDVQLDEFKLIGKEQNHLKVVFSKDDKKLNCIKWNEKDFPIPLNSKCDIAFYPRLNVFNDIETLQLELVDIYCTNININKKGLRIFDHRKKTGILDQISQYLKSSGPNIGVWAKNPALKEKLSKFSPIKDSFIEKTQKYKALMLFDYPSTKEELKEIISEFQPEKIHLMHLVPDENIENYIRNLNGMLKYCHNKLEGKITITKLSKSLQVSETFVLVALEILESIGSIKIIDSDKIEYLKPPSKEDLHNNSMFEVLIDELDNILEFKKTLLDSDIKEVEKIFANI